MHCLLACVTLFSCLASASAGCLDSYANNNVQNRQQAIIADNKPITMTRTQTRTHYEINVVSTVYRTRTHAPHPDPSPHVHLEEAAQTLVFGVEGTGCDMKACTICRMLNNCADDEANCTGCNLAYYCNQCSEHQKLGPVKPQGVHISKVCSLGPGLDVVPCDSAEAVTAQQHEAL